MWICMSPLFCTASHQRTSTPLEFWLLFRYVGDSCCCHVSILDEGQREGCVLHKISSERNVVHTATWTGGRGYYLYDIRLKSSQTLKWYDPMMIECGLKDRWDPVTVFIQSWSVFYCIKTLVCLQSVNGIAYLRENWLQNYQRNLVVQSGIRRWGIVPINSIWVVPTLKTCWHRGETTVFSAVLPCRWWKNWRIKFLGALDGQLIWREMAEDLGISVGSRFIILTENLGILLYP